MPRLRDSPADLRVAVARLVGHEQLDGRASERLGEQTARFERRVALAELGTEEMVDDAEHLRPRAVVRRQREKAVARGSPLPEDVDVRMPEAVDRLELVADEEELRNRPPRIAGAPRDDVDELALQPVRVLELVHHDRAEAKAQLRPRGLVPGEQVPREQLQVLEVDRGLAGLCACVRRVDGPQQLLQQYRGRAPRCARGRPCARPRPHRRIAAGRLRRVRKLAEPLGGLADREGEVVVELGASGRIH